MSPSQLVSSPEHRIKPQLSPPVLVWTGSWNCLATDRRKALVFQKVNGTRNSKQTVPWRWGFLCRPQRWLWPRWRRWPAQGEGWEQGTAITHAALKTRVRPLATGAWTTYKMHVELLMHGTSKCIRSLRERIYTWSRTCNSSLFWGWRSVRDLKNLLCVRVHVIQSEAVRLVLLMGQYWCSDSGGERKKGSGRRG